MRKKVLSFVLFLSFFSSFLVFSQKDSFARSGLPFGINADLSFCSQYVWRGMILDRDAVLQSGVYLIFDNLRKFGKWKLGVWSNQPLESRDDLKSEEFDYLIDYTFDFEKISFSLGHTYYDFAETETYSREFYLGVGFPKLFLSPSVYFYRDYGNPENGGGEGSYVAINVNHSFSIIKSVSIDLSGSLGFNHELFINGDGGDIGLKAAVNIPLSGGFSLVPNINYSIPFADLSADEDGNQKKRVYAGITVTYIF